MKALTYVGPYDAVNVPLPDGETITLKRFASADFPPDVAAGLLEQPSNWQPTKTQGATAKSA